MSYPSKEQGSKHSTPGKLTFIGSSVGLGVVILAMMFFHIYEKNIPEYEGYTEASFLNFIWRNKENIFYLDLTFNEDESERLFHWSNSQGKESPPWMGVHQNRDVDVPLGEPLGMVFRFQNSDGNLYLNTRYPGMVSVSGHFKVHGISGPNRGFYSVILRSVAIEDI